MQKPRIDPVPLADGLRWKPAANFRYEEKLDGRFHVEDLPAATVVGELMHSGAFFAFDVVSYRGEDLRQCPLRERLAVLDTLSLPRPVTGSGGEFLEAVLARGGEGVVAKDLDAAFGFGLWKCKRAEVHFCRVADLDPWTGAAVLQDRDSGEPRGRVALRSRFDLVRVGSVLKVEAYGLTAKGLLREARLDRDSENSWLYAF